MATEAASRTKTRVAIRSGNPTLGQPPEKTIHQRHVHYKVPCSTVYNSQGMQAPKVSTHLPTDTEGMLRTYNGPLLSHKNNKIMPSVANWMDLKITLS